MRPLFVGRDELLAARRIIAYAAEHPYYPGDSVIPGDQPQHVLLLQVGYRAVYSLTLIKGVKYRHLSISVDGPLYPSPEAVMLIAKAFLFTLGALGKTGFPAHWLLSKNEQEHCITVAEVMP